MGSWWSMRRGYSSSVQIWGGALLLGIALWRYGVPHWLRIAALPRAH